MRFDERGREILDPTPVDFPLNFKRPMTIQEQIRTFIRQELSQTAAAQGEETFEEADDFDVDDDFDPTSPWELNYEQQASPIDGPPGAGDPGAPEKPGKSAANPEGVPAVPASGSERKSEQSGEGAGKRAEERSA